MSLFLVYALVDPRTQQVRYIGKSCSGMERPRQHAMPCFLRGKTHKENWVRAVLGAGLEPEIRVLEAVSGPEALSEAERAWITHGREAGWPLTNATSGGDGLPGLVRTAEHRRKVSEALKGRPLPDSTRAAMAAAFRARVAQDPEGVRELSRKAASAAWAKPGAKALASARARAAWEDPATRARMIEARAGIKHTEEHKGKIGAASKKAWQDPEYREKVLASRRGRKLSPEHREKLRIAAVAREARKRNG
jgi:hypothetical protein